MDDADSIRAKLADERARLRSMGWTEHDLAAFERRHHRESEQALLYFLQMMRPLPPTSRREGSGDERVLARIRALLAKAESTTFAAEAEACSAKAQELMTRYRIDRVSIEGNGPLDLPAGRRIWIDSPYVNPKIALLRSVARANGCQAIEIGRMGCVHLIGYERDLELVEMLFTSLLVQAASAMADAGSQVDGLGRTRTRSFRSSFLFGYAWRVGRRLIEVKRVMETEMDTERGGDLLPVLRRREEAVSEAVAEVFPNIQYARPRGVSNYSGWGAGVAAAERAELSSPTRVGASGVPSAIGR
jgi:hypothetical protein